MRLLCFLFSIICLTICFAAESESMGNRPNNDQDGILISITNNSDLSVSSIRVLYSGGAYKIPELRAGETVKSRINPTSESHLEMEFVDEQQRDIKIVIDTYFERDYSGSFSIFINKNGKATWEDNITIKQEYR